MHDSRLNVADARSEADKIVAKAKSDAEALGSKGQMELELAVRDTILKLRELLDRALTHLLFHGTENKLADPNYLEEVIREVVAAYARADAGRMLRMKIDIPLAMRDKLSENALADLFHDLVRTQLGADHGLVPPDQANESFKE